MNFNFCRKYVLHRLSKLKFLDCYEITQHEKEMILKEALFYDVITYKDTADDSTKPPLKSSKNDDVNYTPLPTPNDNGEKTIKGSFGYTKYVYHGKQSEGNRFIKNDDL